VTIELASHVRTSSMLQRCITETWLLSELCRKYHWQHTPADRKKNAISTLHSILTPINKWLQMRPTTGNGHAATKPQIIASITATNSVKIPTANQRFSTIISSIKLSPIHCDNHGEPIAVKLRL